MKTACTLCQFIKIIYLFSQAQEDVSKNLVGMKTILYGTGDQDPQTELVGQLAHTMYDNSLLLSLITNLPYLDFEVGVQLLLLVVLKPLDTFGKQ